MKFNKPDVKDFLSSYEITGFTVSPDDSLIVFCSSLDGEYKLWGMNPTSSYPYCLTHMNQRTDAIVYHPGTDHNSPFILFTGDTDGDEMMQIYAVPVYGGTPITIRSAVGKRHFLADISEDGERIYYSSNKERSMFLNIYKYDLTRDEEKIVLEGTGAANYIKAVNKNEDAFVYVKEFNKSNRPGFVYYQGDTFTLVPDPDITHIVYQATFVDNATVYFLTNWNEQYSYLASYSISTKEFRKIVSIEKEEIHMMGYSRVSNCFYLVAAKGTIDNLYVFNNETHNLENVVIPVEVIAQIQTNDSGSVYLLGSSPTVPTNLYRRVANQNQWEDLTQNRLRGVRRDQLVEPEVLRYKSFDGVEIEALYYRAKDECKNKHTILWPHGGPQYSERKEFKEMFQYLVSLGYNLFAPNFRGSTFYGDHFHRMIERDWGGSPRLDIIAGVEWLIQQDLAERGNLFVVGGSYGGYMTLLLLGRHGELFKAGVDLFGLTNLLTFVDSVPDYWKPRMETWVGHPVRDKEKLIEQSPITYVENMHCPLLIYHGANDARVAKSESDQIIQELHKKGIDVEYVVLNDEGHGSFTKENEIKTQIHIAKFLEKYL